MSQSCRNPAAKAMFGSQIVPFLDPRPRFPAVYLAALLLVVRSVVAMETVQPRDWPTLRGRRPIVIAHGGFSGMYPDSSSVAYNLSRDTGIKGETALWCDVQLTQDGVAICFPSITLDNSSTADRVLKNPYTHIVDGVATPGYFSVDYKFSELLPVKLTQRRYTRTQWFDGLYDILSVKDMVEKIILKDPPEDRPLLWLNVQRPSFYDNNSLDMASHILDLTKIVDVNYISSPDMGFLMRIQAKLNPKTTKLVFRFGAESEREPSTKQTYSSLLKNLKHIKTFAFGILIPKTYIWPVDSDNYLLPHTNVVSDAHNLELEVYASNFMNDDELMSYNYSYDPVAEYLNFIDNDNFCVDGLMSDYTVTAADAIYCFSKHSLEPVIPRKALVISKEGASGDYPGCTDLAYEKAIDDGVDILDCPVQMSQDGTPFCLGSINLMDHTTVAQSTFSNRSITLSNISEINSGKGIFAFSLTWEEIQTLKPEISNPFLDYDLKRNPKHKNEGKFMSLSDFLALANKASSLTGVLINITNAAYLAKYQGLGVVDAVLDALEKADYDKKTGKNVMIQSTNKSVLTKFKNKGNYELVYEVDEVIRDVPSSTVNFIKRFAHSVVVKKTSVFPKNNQVFLNSTTDVVSKLKESGLFVYVETFDNEFVSQPRDFFNDPTVEMEAYVSQAGVEGLVTAFPKTAAAYKKNKCSEGFISDAYKPGFFITTIKRPEPEAPSQVLTESDVAEPPLPPVSDKPTPTAGGPETGAAPAAPNTQHFACLLIPSLAMSISYFFFGSNLFL